MISVNKRVIIDDFTQSFQEENAKLKLLLAWACKNLDIATNLLYSLGYLKKEERFQVAELEKWWDEHNKEQAKHED